ncbi:MAG TPA: hypothetical protein VGW58_01340 [Pyrinomonadaceae bacterium]|nr:hypothetical protein [Pyrinomonadaceae bacterium]
MRHRSLTELASNPDLISGIYNYCDRWCERCPLTSRCLVYATEQVDHRESPKSNDVCNEAFWHKLSSILHETQQMIAGWAKEAGIDLTQVPDEEEVKTRKRRRQIADHHPLARAGKKYANAASDWLRQFDQTNEARKPHATDRDREQLEDAREVIQWYQYQIAVKIMRALSCRSDGWEDEPEMAEFPKDSDGSAKVALIGIDRSIAAWRLVQLSLPDGADSIVPLILQLERLRKRVERSFPEARDFVRPGFDEVLAAAS